MAFAAIPPRGQIHDMEVQMENLRLEQTTVDPVLRYRLREERFSKGLAECSAALVRKAEDNAKVYNDIVRRGEQWK